MATRRGKGRGPKVTPKTGGQFALDYDKPKELPKKMTYAEWRKTLGSSAKVPVKPAPTVPYTRPPFSSGQTPSNAAGASERTGRTRVNWRLGNQGQSIPAGRQTIPVVESTGRSAVPYNKPTNVPPNVPPEKPVFNTPKKPPLRLSSPGGVKYVIDEMGNNVPKPDDYKQLAKFGKAAWKASKIPRILTPVGLGSLVLEEALFPTEYDPEETSSVLAEEQAEFDADNIKDLKEAQDRVDLLTEIGASPQKLAEANRQLTDLQSSIDPQRSITEWEDDVKKDLATNQAIIDAKVESLSFNPEALKLSLKPLLERRDMLESKLNDSASWRKKILAKSVVEKDPDSLSLMSMAQGMDPSKLMPQLGSEDKTTVEDETETALEAFFNGTVKTLKGAMTLAAEGLGSLWGETAIKNALVYYMGARLMGYSASGSGMAAGDVLLKGWENQADVDKVTAEAATKSAENNAIDMSKTVNYVDQYGNFQKVYASKNGKFLKHPKLGTIDVSKTGWRPAAAGEKDRQTRKLDATDSVNKIQDQVLTNLRSQLKNADGEGMYDENNVAKVTQMFQEAGLSQQMVDSYTDSYGIDGLEKSIPLLRRAMESYASSVAGGEDVNIASLMGHLDRSVITSGKTQVPKAVYHSEGKLVGSDAMNILSNKLSKVHQVQNGYIDAVKASPDLTDDQKEEFIYSMKTEGTKADILIQLNKRFNAIPKGHMDFWKKQAKDSNMSSPFIMWLTSVTDPGRQHSSYESLNINVYRDLGLIPSNKKE
jgi:hypothetical protein